ncbi:DUF1599 domain-containing protein [Sphingobacteriales bacterium UPWRP_1]|nr:hypothetical protein BVG80_07090 [Sphingobacteriales bacterium TSM_CSM]PSJ72846.1 DUF1599 domain-containing protein [Sphingobacteriales bacterium UPWRP_1]
MENKTLQEFKSVIEQCRLVFLKKTADYGTAWRILRTQSLTDQIMIKAQRIRNIEETGRQQVADSIYSEYVGIINYSLLALIQLHLPPQTPLELPVEQAELLYNERVSEIMQTLLAKNHDYGDIWRSMRISSFTDLILMKLLRIKQIEDNAGKTLVSEGVDANYTDIINYAVFALIKLSPMQQA